MRSRPLDRFLRLTPADRLLLVQSVVLLGAARLGLWLLPLTVVRRLLARTAPTPSGALATPERIAWAVAVARRVVPRASCLPQALAAEALLTRDRKSTRLNSSHGYNSYAVFCLKKKTESNARARACCAS